MAGECERGQIFQTSPGLGETAPQGVPGQFTITIAPDAKQGICDVRAIGKYGADALRFYMVNSPVVRGEELRFTSLGVDEIFKKVVL